MWHVIVFMQKRYCWAPEHETQIRRNFEEKGASRLRDTFGELRKRRKQPLWLSDSTWKSLQEYWASEKFLKMSSQAKKNRNSEQDGLGPSLHRSGSVPFTEHRRRMVSAWFIICCTYFSQRLIQLEPSSCTLTYSVIV